MSSRRLVWTRNTAKKYLAENNSCVELIFDIVREGAEDAIESNVLLDLRGWQELLGDVATAIKLSHPDLSEQLRVLSGRIYSSVTLISRNPINSSTSRPTSKRVLLALLNFEECTLADIREQTGMCETNISNVIKTLLANKLIKIRTENNLQHISLTPLGLWLTPLKRML